MAEAPLPQNVIPFPTPSLPEIFKTPALAIIVSIFCALPPEVRADAQFNLWRLTDAGDRNAAAAHEFLFGR